MVKVSVIIPVYNAEMYIERCARSLFLQTLEDMEFVFVNDCSTDNSAAILQDLFSLFPNVKATLISLNKNCGVSVARNTGIGIANGEYIGFCDSDDWVEPTMYERLYKIAVSNLADIVGCGFVEHKNGVDTPNLYLQSSDSKELIFSFNHFGGVYGALWNKIIRRDFFVNNNRNLGDGLVMWEDSCLLIPLRLKSEKTVFIDDCLYHYNVNHGSITTAFSIKKVEHCIEATRRLQSFFINEKYEIDSKDFISFLKIACKESLLRYPSISNVILFKNTFPDVNSYIWSYPNWNLILKMRAWLIMVLPFDLAFFVLKHMRK